MYNDFYLAQFLMPNSDQNLISPLVQKSADETKTKKIHQMAALIFAFTFSSASILDLSANLSLHTNLILNCLSPQSFLLPNDHYV